MIFLCSTQLPAGGMKEERQSVSHFKMRNGMIKFREWQRCQSNKNNPKQQMSSQMEKGLNHSFPPFFILELCELGVIGS